MKIYIDGDGCPVIGVTIKIAKQYNIKCILISDTAHSFDKYDIEVRTVAKGADSVDFELVNSISEGDIVITQDYGLAAMCLAKKSIPINQNGIVYTQENIDSFLFTRYLSKKVRMAGGRTKGLPKRNIKLNESFAEVLRKTIEKRIKEESDGN